MGSTSPRLGGDDGGLGNSLSGLTLQNQELGSTRQQLTLQFVTF